MRKRAESAEDQRVIPLVQEEVKIGKRARLTGTTRVRKVVREVVSIADEPLRREEVTVERIPVNRYVERAPAIKEESGTTIIPVMEEVMVVEKRLLLKEEVRISKISSTVHRPQQVTVRREEAVVERLRPGQEQERPAGEAAGKGGKQ